MKCAFARTCTERSNFPSQFCTPRELETIAASDTPILDANKIFSVKEAIGKAFGSGLTEEFWFHDIEVAFDETNVASVAIAEEALRLALDRLSATAVRTTISCDHGRAFVSALCILEEVSAD